MRFYGGVRGALRRAWSSGWYVGAATVLMTTQPLLTQQTKNTKTGNYSYSPFSITMLAEMTKWAVSAALYMRLPASDKSHRKLLRSDFALYAVPGAIFLVNNNLVFYVLTLIDSTTFQILSALKLVFTAVLFRVILRRVLTSIHVVAIILLACGAAVSQLPLASTSDTPLAAFASIVFTCILSASGGIFSELAMKRDADLHSIHLQNILLYSYGVVFNGAVLLAHVPVEEILTGLDNSYVVLLLINNAFAGLFISAILKFGNNLVRLYAHTTAMLLTLVVEALVFQKGLRASLVLSIVIVGSSTYLYNTQPAPVRLETPTRSCPTRGLPRAVILVEEG